MKHEAKAQVTFNKYLRESKMFGFFELKQTDKNYLAFNKIEQVQYDGLQATEKNGLVWKMSDMDIREKPCDCFSVPPLPSYVVIAFGQTFYFIRIKTIVDMRENGKISITLAEAGKVAEKIVNF